MSALIQIIGVPVLIFSGLVAILWLALKINHHWRWQISAKRAVAEAERRENEANP